MQKIKTAGLPYKGGKSKLAERIVSIFPHAEHLYDLFSGGCAIAHCALLKNKFPHVHINDINPMMPQAFVKALQGGFDDEDRWISREDFFKLKDTDPYVAICFSFGNDLKTYCYGKDIEETKKALHYAIFFSSYGLSDRLIGVNLRPIEKCATRQEKYALAKKLIKEAYSRNTPPYNDARKLSKTQTHTDYKVTKGRHEQRRLLFKKNSTRLDLQNLETAQQTIPNFMLQSWQNTRRLQTITPPHYNVWNWKTKKGCLGSRAFQTQRRLVA